VAAPDSRVQPLAVKCWADVRQMDGFDWVTYFLETPNDAPKKEIGNYPGINWDKIPKVGDISISRWDVVVDTNGVFPVFSEDRATTVAHLGRHDEEYSLVGGSWEWEGWGRCGFEGLEVWFYGTGFPVDWVSRCAGGASAASRSGTSSSSVHHFVVHLPDGRVLRSAVR